MSSTTQPVDKDKEEALAGFRRALLEHNEMNARLKERKCFVLEKYFAVVAAVAAVAFASTIFRVDFRFAGFISVVNELICCRTTKHERSETKIRKVRGRSKGTAECRSDYRRTTSTTRRRTMCVCSLSGDAQKTLLFDNFFTDNCCDFFLCLLCSSNYRYC